MKDLYRELGVAKGASEADIKSAYRKLAKQYHPDRNKDDAKAAERFKNASAAYAILGDPDKRAQYDRGEIDADGQPRPHFDFGNMGGARRAGARGRQHEFTDADAMDIFADLFGGGRAGGARGRGGFDFGERPQQRARGADVAYRLKVSFVDAARRETQRITLKNGKTLDVKLPEGVSDGQQIRLTGQGDPGPAGAGDALVTIEVQPHPFFTRDGDDVRLDLPVRLDEAVLGGPVKTPTVDGPVSLNIPAGASSGKTLRLRGKGFTRKGGERGDQLVTVMIVLPEDLSALKTVAEKLKQEETRSPRTAFGLD